MKDAIEQVIWSCQHIHSVASSEAAEEFRAPEDISQAACFYPEATQVSVDFDTVRVREEHSQCQQGKHGVE